jgi:hypothetical protein
MKLNRYLLSALFSVTTLLGFAQTNEWKTYTSDKWHYKADFPGSPEETSQNVPSGVGDLTMDMAMLEGEESVMMTNVTVYPQELMTQMSGGGIDEFFNGMINGAAKSVGGKVLSTENIKYHEYEGREARITAFDGAVLLIMHAYSVDNTVYILQVMYPIEDIDEETMKRFFDSFEIF